jgi:hypothetical protein
LSGDDPSVTDAQEFWALKYSISTLYSGMKVIEVADRPRPQAEFCLLSVLDEKELEAVKAVLDDEEKRFLARLLGRPVGGAYTWRASKRCWDDIGERDSVLYVFCHADGTKLLLPPDDKIDVVEFSMNFEKRFNQRRRSSGHQGGPTRPTYCLCFLNGCSTAAGRFDNSFLTVTARPGFCGFIGTEARVPIEFAGRFGLAALYYLVEKGLAVQEVIDRLRRQHWPLGLLYSNFAHPGFHIEPAADPALTSMEPRFLGTNFSTHRFMSGTI